MACGALQWCWFVKEHLFVSNEANRIVAAITFHPLMTALQRKLRPLVMIECRRQPSLRVMALGARNFFRSRDKLAAVHVCMTLLAALRRSLELNLFCARSWFVASAASYGSMRA
jgi:hypothetical protein